MNEEEMILNNIPLIHYAIKKMNLKWETDDEWQDYYDYGLIGLINGVKSYDNNKENTVSSFLVPCIENNIKHHLVNKTSMGKMNTKGKDISLNQKVALGEESELINFVINKKVNVEREATKNVIISDIIECLNKMENKKDVVVIKLHYGLDGFPEMNYREIARLFKVSDNMIHLRAKRGMKRLKEEMENIYNG